MRSKSLSRLLEIRQIKKLSELDNCKNYHLLTLSQRDYYQINLYETFCLICAKLNIHVSDFSDRSYNNAFNKFAASIKKICGDTVISYNIQSAQIAVTKKW